MTEHLANRRDVLKTGLASMTAGLAMLSLPGFVFPGQADDEEKHWLKELKLLADRVGPEFQALYDECMAR